MGSRCRCLVTGKVCTQHYQLIGDSIGARSASCANNASKPEESPSVLAAVIDSESQVEWIMHPEREGEKKIKNPTPQIVVGAVDIDGMCEEGRDGCLLLDGR